ncbi:hypothetical protein F5Y17DRAFT_433784 [Xylariaceae sp. FL0594]|nr:hypothetical protein F5Y17DRAFT_433784 [Xylariaceae sp. FL0594]
MNKSHRHLAHSLEGSPRASMAHTESSSDESSIGQLSPLVDSPDNPTIGPTTRPPVPGISSTTSAPTVIEPEQSSSKRPGHYLEPLNVNALPVHQSAPHISPLSPEGIRKRRTRADTFRTLEEFEDFERRPGWRPGAEPGVDPKKPDGGQESMPDLHAECQITVVDFSQHDLVVHDFNNSELIDFVQKPQPSWVKCRWINVNGLSWDVIQALGKYKDLHRLAIEDIMNTRNRTKADWYAGHAFLILTCMKLVRLLDDDSDSSDEVDLKDSSSKEEEEESGFLGSTGRRLKRWIAGKRAQRPSSANMLEKGTMPGAPGHSFTHQPTGFSDVFNPNTLCTLQRYHAAPNAARTEYMEKHSALAEKGLAVMAEQVAMFITSDNTVIAFFEQSADDVEEPILARLRSPTTILRQSCDASMVAQAIIDAIIDMAIPVTACYADIVGDLELDVLTHPNIKHTKRLYIIISEINKMFSFVNPIQSLISSLRDHKTKLSQDVVSRELQNPLGGVIITPATYTYLGDVYDHCILITENLTQIKESANHMIDLIFNTIATYQNESMKQLTIVTIIFLPLTFITGYFGQNFQNFPQVTDYDISYFWRIAAPTAFFTVVVLMREAIIDAFVRFFQRRHILGIRKQKKERITKARRREKLGHRGEC